MQVAKRSIQFLAQICDLSVSKRSLLQKQLYKFSIRTDLMLLLYTGGQFLEDNK